MVVTRPGGPEVLEEQERPTPEPTTGEALVRVAAVGVNRADILQRLGRYPVPPGYPDDILGLEFAGTVEALGPDVLPAASAPSPPGFADSKARSGSGPGLGDRVMGITGRGSYAEYVSAPISTLLPAPNGMSLTDAGAIPEVFATAFDAVYLQARLKPGETLLVHAAGSGVGTAAIQLAKASGNPTVGTSRSGWKLERAKRLGLDHPVIADEEWADRALDLTGGRGVDVILDLVGAPYLSGNQRALAKRGRHIVVGVPGGAVGQVDLRRLMTMRASISGTVLRARPLSEKEELTAAMARDLLPGFASGALRPVVDRTFPATEAGAAHTYMAANRNFGKIVLIWS